MALGKLVSMSLSNVKMGEALIVDDLAIGFRIRRSNKFTANTAEFNIRNMSAETVAKFLNKQSTIDFSVGWEDQDKGQLTKIFSGNILRQADTSPSGVDVRYNIQAASMADFAKIKSDRIKAYADAQASRIEGSDKNAIALRKQIKTQAEERQYHLENAMTHANRVVCSFSYAPDTLLTTVIHDLYTIILGLSVNGLANIEGVKLENGLVYAGRARGAMQMIEMILISKGYASYVDNCNAVIYNLANPKFLDDCGFISWDSGLVKLGRLTDYVSDPRKNEEYPPKQMLKLTSLLQPKWMPNGIVFVSTPEVKGNFLIEEVEFYGDNQEGEFLCDATLSYYGEATGTPITLTV